MKFFVLLITIFVAIIGCVIAGESRRYSRTDNQRAPKAGTGVHRNDSPFMIWQIIPKVVDRLKERFPNQNIEIFIPSILKEIQQSIQLQPFSPESFQQLISSLIEQMFQQMNSAKLPTPKPTPGSNTDQEEKPSLDREFEANFNSTSEQSTLASDKPVETSTQLPDLAFDRDPNKRPTNMAEIKKDPKLDSGEELDDDEEEEEKEITSKPVVSLNRDADNHHSVGDLVLYPDDENKKKID